jgi:tryptophan synthase beta subunit
MKLAEKMNSSDAIVVTLSGRGDKDVEIVLDYLRKRTGKTRRKKHGNRT